MFTVPFMANDWARIRLSKNDFVLVLFGKLDRNYILFGG